MKKTTYHIITIIFTLAASTLLVAKDTSTLLSFRQEFVQLVKDVEKCAVSVDAYMGMEQRTGPEPSFELTNSGAGLVLDSQHIIVNQKTVQGSEHITITLYDKTKVKGTLVDSDNNLGLSVIRLDKSINEDFKPKILDTPAVIEPGEPILILSNSLGIMPAVSFGIINCTRNDGMLQLSVDLPAGTSGGAVFDFSGTLIGIVAVEINLFPDELPYSSGLLSSETVLVNPISDVKRSLRRALAKVNKRRIYFGVAVDDWPSHLGGAHVKQVYSGSPAFRAGIKTGDIVISTENRKVATASDLFDIISAHQPEDDVSIQILRGDQIIPISVHLVSPPVQNRTYDNNIPTNTKFTTTQRKKINHEYLLKRIQKLELELALIKEMAKDD